MMTTTTTIKQRGFLNKLLHLGQDPQAWISMLAVVTVLGLASGTFEAPDERPAGKLAQAQASAPAGEQVASLDTGNL